MVRLGRPSSQWGPDTKKIRSLRLVTEKATYGRSTFGVAVRSLP